MPLQTLSCEEAQKRLRNNRRHGRWWFADDLPSEVRALGACERLNSGHLDPLIRPGFSIAKSDTVFTIGSCFARELELSLRRLGMVVSSYPENFTHMPARGEAPLKGVDPVLYRTGYVNKYTIKTMVDELTWAAGEMDMARHPAVVEVSDGRYADLAAHNILAGDDADNVQARRQIMTRLMQNAFTSDVLVVTLGLAEGWRHVPSGVHLVDSPLSLKPDRSDDYVLDILSYADHLNGLARIIELLDRHGKPGWRMLLTVSPVPFLASFTGDDVVIANSYSKSVLRAVAEEVSRGHRQIDYFPSFEMAHYSDPHRVWLSDRRHIQEAFVGEITEMFEKAYLRD